MASTMAVTIPPQTRLSPMSERRKKMIHRTPSPVQSSHNPEFIQQTKEIIHETFHALLLDQGVRLNGYSTGFKEPHFSSDVNRKAYHGLKGACRHFMTLHSKELVDRVEQLDISDSALCSTFHKAMYAMFADDINWGRIVALICFSVLVAIKAYQSSNYVTIQSIEGWLTTFIIEYLQPFIMKHKGWVSISSIMYCLIIQSDFTLR